MHLSVPVYYCDCFDFKHILHKTGPSAICRIYSLELPNILKQQPLTTFLDPAATRSIPSPGHGLHPLQLAEAGGVVSVRWQYVGICCDAWAAEECFSSNTANTGTAWGCHGCDRSKTCWSWITCTLTHTTVIVQEWPRPWIFIGLLPSLEVKDQLQQLVASEAIDRQCWLRLRVMQSGLRM